MIKVRKIILYFIFGICFLSNNMNFAVGSENRTNEKDVDDYLENIMPGGRQGFRITPRQIGKFAKYCVAAISIFYAVNGCKKTVESAKLLLPVGLDLQFSDLLKFPLKLIAFPFKVVDVGRCFVISGGMGALFYGLHKIGV
ncbi:MAG: hypothetical protein UR12_C0037G0015 [candidate division TM6 bacterium GW2011_GWF2_30_66]|jgi:hypothetical protein|nr:MAG: hypothetical protein UR12_C0037G0015 [candidate division TM6 bacterium GW2011_GWF2_30_66]